MSDKTVKEVLILKEFISKKEYQELNELEAICREKDGVSLKIELNYKLSISNSTDAGSSNINEFLYYINNRLVSYLGISSFSDGIAEINGMTHPGYRRKGMFQKLFQLALEECRRREYKKILLLTDDRSASGIAFINSTSAQYDFSEYRMKVIYRSLSDPANSITLRKADQLDVKGIKRQDSIYFDDPEIVDDNEPIDEHRFNSTYMVELGGKTIGKICMEYTDHTAYIFGFGILPEFRGKGYGRAALTAAMNLCHRHNRSMIELDVACKNRNALNLYTSCGFEVQSVMNYYTIT